MVPNGGSNVNVPHVPRTTNGGVPHLNGHLSGINGISPRGGIPPLTSPQAASVGTNSSMSPQPIQKI